MNIKIKDLSFSYNGKIILDNLSVGFEPASIYGILAPNGSGKTTLINLIMDFLEPDYGEIIFEGELSPKDISLVQGGDKNLYMKNTVEENLYFFSVLKGLEEKEIEENIRRYSQVFEIYNYIKDKVCESLSYGQKRMVSIFIGLVCESKIIIIDEATQGLDMYNIGILEDLILSVYKDKIIIIVSHDYDFIEKLASVKYFLKNGKLIQGSKNLSVRENYNNIFKGAYDHV